MTRKDWQCEKCDKELDWPPSVSRLAGGIVVTALCQKCRRAFDAWIADLPAWADYRRLQFVLHWAANMLAGGKQPALSCDVLQQQWDGAWETLRKAIEGWLADKIREPESGAEAAEAH